MKPRRSLDSKPHAKPEKGWASRTSGQGRVVQPHDTFGARPDGGHDHVNHRGHSAPLGAHPLARRHRARAGRPVRPRRHRGRRASRDDLGASHPCHRLAGLVLQRPQRPGLRPSRAARRRRHLRLDHLRRAHPQYRPRIRARRPHRLVRPDRPVAGLPHLAARAARRANHLRGHGRDRHRRQPEETRRSNPGHMHRGHDLWNISLKFLCEGTQD